jgi:hypothetical protein
MVSTDTSGASPKAAGRSARVSGSVSGTLWTVVDVVSDDDVVASVALDVDTVSAVDVLVVSVVVVPVSSLDARMMP